MASGWQGATLGPYRVIEQVGLGGMATVHKAYQPSMQRYVALKILPQHFATDPQFVERFIREARTIARLEHKNILPVYDFGEENGVTYLAMRYLEGGTLKDVLGLGRLTLTDAGEIIAQVCAALDYAHRHGVIHRDVKPANIMIDDEGSTYLTDFGIAKVLEGTAGLTESGAAIGTPAYMAPEQSLGTAVDGRADIYALGVILYEMIVGRAPYQADTPMAVALAHIHDPLPLPRSIDPTIPEAVEVVIIKALAKNPDDRYQTPNELASDLKKAIDQAGADRSQSTLRALAAEARETFKNRLAEAGKLSASRPRPAVSAPRPQPTWLIGALVGVGVVAIIAIIASVALLATNRAGRGVVSTSAAETGQAAVTVSPTTDLTPYDAFDDPAYDGIYNPSLWYEQESNNCELVQHDGMLVLTNTVSSVELGCSLIAGRPMKVTVGELRSLEVRMRMSGRAGGSAGQSLNITAEDSSSNWSWDAYCGLESRPDGITAIFYVGNVGANDELHDQFIQEFLAEYDRWYTIRLTVDPDTVTVSCTVDGDLLGSAIPNNATKSGDERYLRKLGGWRQAGASATSYFDDFRILP